MLLRATAAGVCHSDIPVMSRPVDQPPFSLPLTLGHEGVGTVTALGPGAGELGIRPPGLGAPGALAEYMIVDGPRPLVPLGDPDPAHATPRAASAAAGPAGSPPRRRPVTPGQGSWSFQR